MHPSSLLRIAWEQKCTNPGEGYIRVWNAYFPEVVIAESDVSQANYTQVSQPLGDTAQNWRVGTPLWFLMKKGTSDEVFIKNIYIVGRRECFE